MFFLWDRIRVDCRGYGEHMQTAGCYFDVAGVHLVALLSAPASLANVRLVECHTC